MKRIIQSLLLVGILTCTSCDPKTVETEAKHVVIAGVSAEQVTKIRKAADQGNAKAQCVLGGYYRKGEGVPKDAVEAAKWYRKSADQGLAVAQGLLGAGYLKGEGVPKDFVMAYMWINLSEAGGFTNATALRKLIESKMTSEQIAEAQKLSREWKPKKEGKSE